MKKRFLKWLIAKLPKQEVTPELRKRIKVEFPGYHLGKNPPKGIKKGERKKEVTRGIDLIEKYDEVTNEQST